MKTKLLLATLLVTFSANSFATGTIECRANAVNSKGKKVTIGLMTNAGFGERDLASDLQVTPNMAKGNTYTIAQEKVTEFKMTSKILLIKVTDKKTKRNVLELSYNPKKQKGVMLLNTKDSTLSSDDVTCTFDF